MAVNHPLNAWNFLLAWFAHLEVPSRFGMSIPSDIGEKRNMSFLLRHMELVLIYTDYSHKDYLFTLDNQRVLSL